MDFVYSEKFTPEEIILLKEKIGNILNLMKELEDVNLTFTIDKLSKKVLFTEMAAMRPNLFKLELRPDVSYHTLGHELTHVLQRENKFPEGEFEADIFPISKGEIFLDSLPTYLFYYILCLPKVFKKLNLTLESNNEKITSFIENCWKINSKESKSKKFKKFVFQSCKRAVSANFSEDAKISFLINIFNFILKSIGGRSFINIQNLSKENKKQILILLKKQEYILVNFREYV